MNFMLKAGAALSLIALCGTVLWIFSHLRRIRREAAEHEAIPKSGPKANFLVLLGTSAVALLSLLIFCLVEMK